MRFLILFQLLALLSTQWGTIASQLEILSTQHTPSKASEAPLFLASYGEIDEQVANVAPPDNLVEALLRVRQANSFYSTEDSLLGQTTETKNFLVQHKTVTVFLVLGVILLAWYYVINKEAEMAAAHYDSPWMRSSPEPGQTLDEDGSGSDIIDGRRSSSSSTDEPGSGGGSSTDGPSSGTAATATQESSTTSSSSSGAVVPVGSGAASKRTAAGAAVLQMATSQQQGETQKHRIPFFLHPEPLPLSAQHENAQKKKKKTQKKRMSLYVSPVKVLATTLMKNGSSGLKSLLSVLWSPQLEKPPIENDDSGFD